MFIILCQGDYHEVYVRGRALYEDYQLESAIREVFQDNKDNYAQSSTELEVQEAIKEQEWETHDTHSTLYTIVYVENIEGLNEFGDRKEMGE